MWHNVDGFAWTDRKCHTCVHGMYVWSYLFDDVLYMTPYKPCENMYDVLKALRTDIETIRFCQKRVPYRLCNHGHTIRTCAPPKCIAHCFWVIIQKKKRRVNPVKRRDMIIKSLRVVYRCVVIVLLYCPCPCLVFVLVWSLSCLVLSFLVLSCLVLSGRILFSLVLSGLVLSCIVLCCIVLSCVVVSCRV